tara:strand:- start:93 stop:221 length:129 start_codon:yes stop_codon:yes gene_type:complete
VVRVRVRNSSTRLEGLLPDVLMLATEGHASEELEGEDACTRI